MPTGSLNTKQLQLDPPAVPWKAHACICLAKVPECFASLADTSIEQQTEFPKIAEVD
jgi:hypothetical protein